MGRHAAIEIDKALGGDGNIDDTLTEREVVDHRLGKVENFASLERVSPTTAGGAERVNSFVSIEETFGQDEACSEAARCLGCHLRLAIAEAVLPPRVGVLLELTPEAIETVPETEGVYQLFDDDKNVISIKGVMNLKVGLSEAFEENESARFFTLEQDPMYTKRESELIQQYIQEHGQLPGGGADELDDLF
jgi:formate dehydrogenase beta subunit